MKDSPIVLSSDSVCTAKKLSLGDLSFSYCPLRLAAGQTIWGNIVEFSWACEWFSKCHIEVPALHIYNHLRLHFTYRRAQTSWNLSFRLSPRSKIIQCYKTLKTGYLRTLPRETHKLQNFNQLCLLWKCKGYHCTLFNKNFKRNKIFAHYTTLFYNLSSFHAEKV